MVRCLIGNGGGDSLARPRSGIQPMSDDEYSPDPNLLPKLVILLNAYIGRELSPAACSSRSAATSVTSPALPSQIPLLSTQPLSTDGEGVGRGISPSTSSSSSFAAASIVSCFIFLCRRKYWIEVEMSTDDTRVVIG